MIRFMGPVRSNDIFSSKIYGHSYSLKNWDNMDIVRLLMMVPSFQTRGLVIKVHAMCSHRSLCLSICNYAHYIACKKAPR